MSRSLVTVRPAVPGDAPTLAVLWADLLDGADDAQRITSALAAVDRADLRGDHDLLVAVVDGRVVGAIYLVATTISPLSVEPMIQVVAPTVSASHARRGVGAALMEAAVGHAEARGIGTIAAAGAASSRDGNRFLARLGLTPAATLRIAPVSTLKARLVALRPVSARQGAAHRQRDRVLAARRILRRERI